MKARSRSGFDENFLGPSPLYVMKEMTQIIFSRKSKNYWMISMKGTKLHIFARTEIIIPHIMKKLGPANFFREDMIREATKSSSVFLVARPLRGEGTRAWQLTFFYGFPYSELWLTFINHKTCYLTLSVLFVSWLDLYAS